MARLKTIYDTEEDIPEGYVDLYTERNGKWELTGIEGVKTQADVERVQEALRKEKVDHKATKLLLTPFEGLDPEVIVANQNKLEEVTAQLEAINKDGRVDEAKLEPIIAARIKQAVAPLERDKLNLERQLDGQKKLVTEKDGEVVNLRTSITMGDIERQIRDAAATALVQPSAIFDAIRYGREVFEKTDDGRVITKDVAGVTPGLSPKEWFQDQKEKSPHWWPGSVGGGSQGSGSGRGGYAGVNNPWSKEGWNITKQGVLVKTLGIAKAEEIAALVGSKVGSTKAAA